VGWKERRRATEEEEEERRNREKECQWPLKVTNAKAKNQTIDMKRLTPPPSVW
jgi:hypothetical protein